LFSLSCNVNKLRDEKPKQRKGENNAIENDGKMIVSVCQEAFCGASKSLLDDCIHLELFPIQELFLFSFPQANRTRMQEKTAVQAKQFT